MSGEVCDLCTIEERGGYIWFGTGSDGMILIYDFEQGDLYMKLEAKDFCDVVRKQYPRREV